MDASEKMVQIKALENEPEIRSVLNRAYEILGHPIMMFDTSYNMIAYTQGIITDDMLWNEIATFGVFSPESVDFFNREGFIERFAQSDVVSVLQSDKLKYDRMNGKLFDEDNVQLGNISVVACKKPFDEHSAELVAALCDVLSVKLRESEFYAKIDRVYQKTFIDELLDANALSSQPTKDKVNELYAKSKSNLYFAVMDITQYEPTRTHLAYYRDIFKKLQPEYDYYVHLTNIVAFISTDNATLSIKKDLGALNKFFEEYNIYAGISGQFFNIYAINEYFRQAITALNYGIKSKTNRKISYYDSFRLEHFLHLSDLNTTEALSPIIHAIEEYDSAHNMTLFETLHRYLMYAMNAQLTCEDLGISTSTFNKQIELLEDIFGLDWTDFDMLCTLYLSIKMLEN